MIDDLRLDVKWVIRLDDLRVMGYILAMNYKLRQDKMRLLKKQGFTFTEIGKKFGVSRQRAEQILNERLTKYLSRTPVPINCLACGKRFLTLYPKTQKYCFEHSRIVKSLQGIDRTRELVRIRDKRTCQDCGRKWQEGERRFDVHHLNGLCGKMSRSYDGVLTAGGLVTYCHKCHMSKHVAKDKFSNLKLDKKKIQAIKILDKSFTKKQISEIIGTSITTIARYLK